MCLSHRVMVMLTHAAWPPQLPIARLRVIHLRVPGWPGWPYECLADVAAVHTNATSCGLCDPSAGRCSPACMPPTPPTTHSPPLLQVMLLGPLCAAGWPGWRAQHLPQQPG